MTYCAGDKPISPYHSFYEWREQTMRGPLTTLHIEEIENRGIKEYITFSYTPGVYDPEVFQHGASKNGKYNSRYWDYGDWSEQRVDDCQSTIEIVKFHKDDKKECITFSYNYVDQLWHHEVGCVFECIEGDIKGWIFLQSANQKEWTILNSPQNEHWPHVANMCGYRTLKTDERMATCKFKKVANRYYPMVVGGYQYPPAVIDRPVVSEEFPWWYNCGFDHKPTDEEYQEWKKKQPKNPLFDPTPESERPLSVQPFWVRIRAWWKKFLEYPND